MATQRAPLMTSFAEPLPLVRLSSKLCRLQGLQDENRARTPEAKEQSQDDLGMEGGGGFLGTMTVV